MPIRPEILAVMRREEMEKEYRRRLRKRMRLEREVRPPDPWGKYWGDPIGFITEGLGQCNDDSWRNWRTILKAAYGQSLNADEMAFFRSVADRDPPRKQVRELWLVIGRRGGKDSIASLVSLYAGIYADCKLLRPGERALVACFATDKDQASIVFSYIRGYFESIPSLRSRLEGGELPESYRVPIRLNNSVDVQVVTNNFRSPRGRPIAAAVFDEVAFWKSEDSATPDVETAAAVMPGMATVIGSMLIGISSPHMQRGLLYDKWRRYYAQNDDDVLVIRAGTRVMNPMIDVINPGMIERAIEDDPERARAEYAAEWRRDLADYIPRDVVEGLVVRGRFELPRVAGIEYRSFFDASGGTSDSMTLGIAHREVSGCGILDCLREVRPPFDPSTVIRDFAMCLRDYAVTVVRGDRYAGIWPESEFGKHGIGYEPSEQSKSEIYLTLLPLLMSGRVELLDNRRMVDQIVSLERRTVRNGRDTVDHPLTLHDDLANVAAGSLVMVTSDEQVSLWSLASLA